MKCLSKLELQQHGENEEEWSPHLYRWNLSNHPTIGSIWGNSPASTISFQSPTLEQSIPSSASPSAAPEAPISPMTSDDEEATSRHTVETGQRDILDAPFCCLTDSDAAMDDSSMRQVSLEPRKPPSLDVRSVSASSENEHLTNSVSVWDPQLVSPMSSFASTSSVSTATRCTRPPPAEPNIDQGMASSRPKRRRGESDCSMTMVSDNSDDYAPGVSSQPRDRRKRLRLSRNRALGAQEFDAILSQICTIGPY